MGPSWSDCSWIYECLCNQCLSPLKLWVWILLRRGVLDTTLCNKVWQWLAAGRWFSPGTLVSFTNKTDHHDITEILLKVVLNTINLTLRILWSKHRRTVYQQNGCKHLPLSVLFQTFLAWWHFFLSLGNKSDNIVFFPLVLQV